MMEKIHNFSSYAGFRLPPLLKRVLSTFFYIYIQILKRWRSRSPRNGTQWTRHILSGYRALSAAVSRPLLQGRVPSSKNRPNTTFLDTIQALFRAKNVPIKILISKDRKNAKSTQIYTVAPWIFIFYFGKQSEYPFSICKQ